MHIIDEYKDTQINMLACATSDIIMRSNIHPALGLELVLNDFKLCEKLMRKEIDHESFVAHFFSGEPINSLEDDPQLVYAMNTMLMGIFGMQRILEDPMEDIIDEMNETNAWEYIACCGRHLGSYPYETISEDIIFFMTDISKRSKDHFASC